MKYSLLREIKITDKCCSNFFNRTHISGEEVNVLMGLTEKSAYTLWAEKRGLAEPTTTDENSTDRYMKEAAAKIYGDRVNKTVKKCGRTFTNPVCSFATDTVLFDIAGDQTIIIADNPPEIPKAIAFGGNLCPAEYYYRALHMMSVTGCERVAVALLANGAEFAFYEVWRVEAEVQKVKRLEKRFLECVKTGEPPVVDGAAGTVKTLDEIHAPAEESYTDLICCDRKIDRYIEIGEKIQELQAERIEIERDLKARMVNFSVGQSVKYIVTWKKRRYRRFNSDRFREEVKDFNRYYEIEEKYDFQIKKKDTEKY